MSTEVDLKEAIINTSLKTNEKYHEMCSTQRLPNNLYESINTLRLPTRYISGTLRYIFFKVHKCVQTTQFPYS